MIKVDVSVQDQITGDLQRIKRELAKVPKESLAEFKSLTPIRTGNARLHTYLDRDTIHADYPYAERLDEGYSKQAPSGMTKPFERWWNNRIQKIMGK